MIKIKQTLSEKDRKEIFYILEELMDSYRDFYLTKNNLRIYIKENMQLLYKCLNEGDRVIFEEGGVAIITGFADKSPRKYLKILAKDNKITDKILKNIDWNIPSDLYIKIKKTNPLKAILLKNKFKFLGDRGKEILLFKKGERYVRPIKN